MSGTRLNVVAAIVRDTDGRLLLSQRPAHKHQGGRWEFPGGKVEPNETLHEALARELHEELGIDILASAPFMTIDHHYPELSVRLHFREVDAWQGMPHGREQQPFDWFDLDQLHTLSFPAANKPVVAALSLPDRWLILPDDYYASAAQDWPQQVLARGVGGVYLRGARAAGAEKVSALVTQCRAAGLRTLVRDDVRLAEQVGADGVHFSAAVAAGLTQRPSTQGIVSMACHDQVGLAHAAVLGVDMVMLSPVHATSTHPDAQPLQWSGFEALASGRAFSVYALGGMAESSLAMARDAGARGIAAISAFWPAD